jgi:hypothetical protein
VNTQTPRRFYIQWCLISMASAIYLSASQAILANSADYGFDFDETELDNGQFVQRLPGLSDRPIPQVEAGEFEARYHWFIS